MGKTLEIQSYKVFLNMQYSIKFFIIEFRFYGKIDVHFNSGTVIEQIPFDVDCITGQPHISYYYDLDVFKKKYPKHYSLIKSILFPQFSKHIQNLFKKEMELRIKNIQYTPELTNFEKNLEFGGNFE